MFQITKSFNSAHIDSTEEQTDRQTDITKEFQFKYIMS